MGTATTTFVDPASSSKEKKKKNISGNPFGRIRTAVDMDPRRLTETYIPNWNVVFGSRLNNATECHEILDGFSSVFCGRS